VDSSQSTYRKLCRSNSEIRIFARDWWLDAVTGPDNWDAAIVHKNNAPVAALPFTVKKLIFWQIYKMPELTPWLQLWIDYPDGQKYSSRLGYEKEMIGQLIEKLPSFHRFRQKYSYELTNWLAFYWHDFQQTTRYSYVLSDLSDLNEIFKGFRENIRREIRKAQKHVKIIESNDINSFFHLNQLTFYRQKARISYSKELVKKVDAACVQKDCRKILLAKDDENRIHAGIYLVWDHKSVYYLMGGSDPSLRNSGANSLLMWHGIKMASSLGKAFDFEGSMMEPIERFFRSFGAVQTPYFEIMKNRFPFQLIDLVS